MTRKRKINKEVTKTNSFKTGYNENNTNVEYLLNSDNIL